MITELTTDRTNDRSRNRRRRGVIAALIAVAGAVSIAAAPTTASAANGWTHDGRGNWFKDADRNGIFEEIRIDRNLDHHAEYIYMFFPSGDLQWMNLSAVGGSHREMWADFRYRGIQLWFDADEDGRYETRYYDAHRDGEFERVMTDSDGNGVADGAWGWTTATSSTSGGSVATAGLWGADRWYEQIKRQCGCDGAELHLEILAQLSAL